MAVQRIGGSRVYVITGSNKDARLTSSGQSWANLVTSQKYKMYAEAKKATLMDIKDTERRYQEELKINAQIRKDINAEIDDKQKLKDKYMLEGAKSAQKIKENETIALKLLGAIETLEYLPTNTEEQEVDTVEE